MSNDVKIKAIDQVSLYMVKIRKLTFVDTQAICTKLLRHLEGHFGRQIEVNRKASLLLSPSKELAVLFFRFSEQVLDGDVFHGFVRF